MYAERYWFLPKNLIKNQYNKISKYKKYLTNRYSYVSVSNKNQSALDLAVNSKLPQKK